MDMREAFEEWIKTKMRGITVGNLGEWWAWQAACEWQRQKDAEIADSFYQDIRQYTTNVPDISSAILNQYNKLEGMK